MLIILGVWLALAGAVAALAGLAGMHRVRRLRRGGVATWALPVTWPGPEPGQEPGAGAAAVDQPSSGSPPRVLLQYTLPDGRVIESSARARTTKSASLRPGEPVLIWYDPRDPDDVLVYGRWGRAGNRAFVAAGTLLVILGVALAIAGP